MAKKSKENASDSERINKGELLLRVVLEIGGSPKDHVEKAITLLVDKLEEKDYVSKLVSEEVLEATQHPQHEQVFTSIAELEFWLKTPDHLVDLAFDFMPASIEVVEPEHPGINNRSFSSLLNELMAKLHKSDMMVKNLSAQKQMVERNSNILLRNFIVNALKSGDRSADEIAKSIGMPGGQLDKFLGLLVKGKEITKEGDVYSVSRPSSAEEKPNKSSKKKSSKN